ncbi:MAG: hypothetical protein CMG75_01590 [Candidatus Marinimicrobia bacterium]|nr:hypothetical protein [Candidatus Neomarinimicrobiota bacterium]|tara:strand:+ start:8603 stop:8929 length:327 start_codon:yes stop_codon:yes gene_type:complete
MTVDLNNADSTKNYLSNKLDDLIEGISDSYGTVLMDELILRLENTVKEFNEEVGSLMGELKEKGELRDELMKKIKNSNLDEPELSSEIQSNPAKEMSAWEKKLEALDK